MTLVVRLLLLLHGFVALAFWALAALSAARIFWGFPVGWGVALAFSFAVFGGGAWRAMVFMQQTMDVENPRNAYAALCAGYLVSLCALAVFLFSDAPFTLSAWWGLSLPLVFVAQFFVQGCAEWIFDHLRPLNRS